MWGNPMRERERSYCYASGKYKTVAKPHFQPRKIPHSTKSVPQKSASFFVPKSYCCTASSIPRFSCPQSVVRTVPYGLETVNRKHKSVSKSMPEAASIFVPNPYNCTNYIESYRLCGSVEYGLPQQKKKIFWPKNLKKEISRFVPSFLGKRALFAAHFPLSSMLRKSL
jgi:hypothetical protein